MGISAYSCNDLKIKLFGLSKRFGVYSSNRSKSSGVCGSNWCTLEKK